MRRHVIRAFGIVNVSWIAVRRETREDGLEVAPYVGIGVLAEDERSARVLQENGAKAVANSTSRHRSSNLRRNLCRTASASAEFQDFVLQHLEGRDGVRALKGVTVQGL